MQVVFIPSLFRCYFFLSKYRINQTSILQLTKIVPNIVRQWSLSNREHRIYIEARERLGRIFPIDLMRLLC